MKKSDRVKKQASEVMNKIRSIARHVRSVEDNCVLLAEKLLDQGKIDLAKKLVANGMVHDASKFSGIEFEYLSLNNPSEENNKLKLKLAIHHHNSTSPHHPEFWELGIKGMPDVYLAEFCCDIKSRSEEFGTDVRTWINETATKRWNFTKDDEVYKKIMEYVDLLCPVPFREVK